MRSEQHPVGQDVATGLAFPESPIVQSDGSVLVSEMAASRVTRITEGAAEEYAATGGGPNGIVAIGDHLIVCQSGGAAWGTGPWPYDYPGAAQIRLPVGPAPDPVIPQVQRISRDRTVSTVATTFLALDGRERALIRPSDVCSDGAGGFYMTDGGTINGRTRELTGLLHGTASGRITEIAYPLEMPNGVVLSPDGTSLYVAETRTRRVWRFNVARPGVITGASGFVTVPSGGPLNIGGADGLCVTSDGCVIVATLGAGGVTVYDPAGILLLQIGTDDPMATNAIVDEPRDRLLLTLASSGRLVAIQDWSRLVSGARERARRSGQPAASAAQLVTIP